MVSLLDPVPLKWYILFSEMKLGISTAWFFSFLPAQAKTKSRDFLLAAIFLIMNFLLLL